MDRISHQAEYKKSMLVLVEGCISGGGYIRAKPVVMPIAMVKILAPNISSLPFGEPFQYIYIYIYNIPWSIPV